MANDLDILKQDIFDYAKLRLGGQMVDVELDPEHYEAAYKRTIEIYRARAQNSQEESYAFLTLAADTQEYILPKEVQQVRQIFRRTIGTSSNDGGNQFEPFEAGYINTYLLTAGRTGGMLSYELYTQYQELTARMFGGFINYTFNPATKKLVIVRRPHGTGEIVLLWTFNMKPEVQLLTDVLTLNWIKEHTYSLCKHMLGQAYSKFASINGPQGGTSLNGESIKTEAQAEMDRAMEDLKLYVDGSQPMGFIIG